MFDYQITDPIVPTILAASLDSGALPTISDHGEPPVVAAAARTNLMLGDLVETNRASVNGRAWMSTIATVRRVFDRGTRAGLLSDPIRSDGHIWVKLRLLDDSNGEVYFVAARYLDLVEARTDVPLTVLPHSTDSDGDGLPYRTGDLIHTTVRIKLRAAPGRESPVVRNLAPDSLGTVLAGFERMDEIDWIQIALPGSEGWLAAKHTRLFARGGKWIEVDLSNQELIAWNDRVEDVRMTISSGKPGFRTPVGTFRISGKYPARRTVATVNGEHWDIPGVPWVMVFRRGGYYFHGAYWHNDFGAPVSHGCVTLPVPSAEQLYDWTPSGTPVWIHE